MGLLFEIADDYLHQLGNIVQYHEILGSPLSFHLNPIEHITKIKSNIVPIENLLYTEYTISKKYCA